MLKTLRRIVQEVNGARNLQEALQIMVRRVRDAVITESCSVYLIDPKQGRYVLMAAEGFKAGAVGRITIGLDEGLVGLIGRREEPINLENAPAHPDYKYFPETGEERYQAFMGVPIIHQRKVLGVLVVQQQEQRRFDEGEEAFLVTMSAQLAGVIAHAEATGGISTALGTSSVQEERTLVGVPGAPGVVIGRAIVVYPLADLDAVPDKITTDIATEKKVFHEALEKAREEIKALASRLEVSLPPEERALFDAYLRILDNSSLGGEVEAEIEKGHWAQGALRKVIKAHVALFEEMDDDYLQERAVDIKDLGRRVLAQLQSSSNASPDYREQTILVGDEVTASRLAEVPHGYLSGVVSGSGSRNSHVAILARAMGIPTVMGAEGLSLADIEGKTLIVDGYNGRVYLSPSSNLIKEFSRLVEEERELYEGLRELRDEPAETPDGCRVPLMVNTGLVADIASAKEAGAEGVGLYRTEVPFMIRDRFPGEEEQRLIYRQLLEAFAPKSVVMRTLDVGGDKMLPYFNVAEDNPFLGWRGIRITLDHPEIFLVQVRAMLRASVGLNNLSIMLPMISGLGEVNEALRLINQAHLELVEEGLEITMPKIGVMIEVPSAVYQARHLARRVDFLSVGSNDLTQYILAVDRNNSRVANIYDSLHPAVLQALYDVVQAGHAENKCVTICGEMAGDPRAVVLLLAMGFDHLSMNATSLARIKWVIRNINKSDAQKLLHEVMELSDPLAIKRRIDSVLEGAGLGGLIRAGK